jgi:hypothetical protein
MASIRARPCRHAHQHVEFRDDRFVVAARLAGEMHFFYRVRVVTPGRFVVPPTYAEDMYQPQVYGLPAATEETLLISDGSGTQKAGSGEEMSRRLMAEPLTSEVRRWRRLR